MEGFKHTLSFIVLPFRKMVAGWYDLKLITQWGNTFESTIVEFLIVIQMQEI